MLSNVGHTIQKMINNTPSAITVNETSTSVVTSGGNVFQAGLVSNKIQHSFHEIISNADIQGDIIDAKATESKVYFLNSYGYVFEYDYNAQSCSPVVREVYSPIACGGDNAISIDSGREHLLILTAAHRVWGVGCNKQYQLVPQGQCLYDVAVEIVITDTNIHDNCCCERFIGFVNELTTPVIPQTASSCNEVVCVKNTAIGQQIGVLNIVNVTVTPNPGDPGTPITGTLIMNVLADYSYVGFLCVGCDGMATGTVTYTITSIYIPGACGSGTLDPADVSAASSGVTLSLNDDFTILGTATTPATLTSTVTITGQCGTITSISVVAPDSLDVRAAAATGGVLTLTNSLSEDVTVTSIGNALTGTPLTAVLDFSSIDRNGIEVFLNCCSSVNPSCSAPVVVLPQPCWVSIYAGFDTSVLVDSCNRLYVLGSIHEVRNNKHLLQRNCLEELLERTDASISLPADQLNCCVRPRNETCRCVKCRDQCFKTDLSKFGVQLTFRHDDCHEDASRECDALRKTNVCDFLKALQNCNEKPLCDNTCSPCDGYIYLNVCGDCGCDCGPTTPAVVGSVTLLNRISVCKTVSQGVANTVTVPVTVFSLIEFDLNQYCIDGTCYPLEQTIVLTFGPCVEVTGTNVDLYIDLNKPGGIRFTSNGRLGCTEQKKCNVEFTLNASTTTQQYILTYGGIMDPVQLTNLKQALLLDPFYPCPRFLNPFTTKIINTYLQGGDSVKFILQGSGPIRQMVTADLPTVFRLNRRVLDIGVGLNNLSVLVGGLACPNEIFAIGNNCHGELGLHSNESVVCFRQVNRCLFDCQVSFIFSGRWVTFYVTQSYRVYASGQWKCLVDTNIPVCVPSICQAWRIFEIAISKNQIVMIGADGSLFGLGDNSLGELGLCHVECVRKFTQLSFFIQLNKCIIRQLNDSLRHPIERNGLGGLGLGGDALDAGVGVGAAGVGRGIASRGRVGGCGCPVRVGCADFECECGLKASPCKGPFKKRKPWRHPCGECGYDEGRFNGNFRVAPARFGRW